MIVTHYNKLKNKHLKMIDDLNVNISFDIKELENRFFNSLDYLRVFLLIVKIFFLIL